MTFYWKNATRSLRDFLSYSKIVKVQLQLYIKIMYVNFFKTPQLGFLQSDIFSLAFYIPPIFLTSRYQLPLCP